MIMLKKLNQQLATGMKPIVAEESEALRQITGLGAPPLDRLRP